MTESITDVHSVSLVVAAFGVILEAAFVPYGLVTGNWVPAGLDGLVIALGVSTHIATSKPSHFF